MALSPEDLNEVRALCAAGRLFAAVRLCAEFIAEHPDHPHGYHMRAVVRVLAGEPHLALADRDKVVALCPGAPGAYIARAEDRVRAGLCGEAAADLDRAEKLDDGHFWPLIPFLRAQCRLRLGQFDAALADLAKVPEGYLFSDGAPDFLVAKPQVLEAIARAQLSAAQEGEAAG
jgi:tetratricopeptide (TPR) repeat protein